MKFFETHFEEYIKSSEKQNLHPELEKKIISQMPKNFNNLQNLIIYGPSGISKYTQSLNIIKNFSESELKYEKKNKCHSQ